jgi:cyclophilin family peptidyl-prolyl cis-trans isomerase
LVVGISDKPEYKHWHNQDIRDDPNLNKGINRGYLSFAGGGPNTRSTQLFIAFEDLDFLGKEPWETPFGKVTEGYETLDALYKEYGDIPPFGKGPDQQKIHNRGNAYLKENFPMVDYIISCEVVGSAIIQQTPFDPAIHAHENRQPQDEVAPKRAGEGGGAVAVRQQTPFDPAVHNREVIPQANDHAANGNLREQPSTSATTPYSFKKMLQVAGLFVSGVGIAVMITLHLRRRLASITKDN